MLLILLKADEMLDRGGKPGEWQDKVNSLSKSTVVSIRIGEELRGRDA